MKPARTLVLAAALAAGLTAQQSSPEKPFRYNGNAHLYFATGACQHGYAHVGAGGGGEGFLWRGLALGADLGYHRFVDDVGFGLMSLTVGYHFVDRKKPKKFDPFVNFTPLGAYIANGIGPAGSLGGGLNWWFKPRMALRTEVRFQALNGEEALTMFRIGLSFR
jgi:hypothetical protein